MESSIEKEEESSIEKWREKEGSNIKKIQLILKNERLNLQKFIS